jgi:hypothetical protein
VGEWSAYRRIFLLTNSSEGIIPPQYINDEERVELFWVPDPFGVKGSGF